MKYKSLQTAKASTVNNSEDWKEFEYEIKKQYEEGLRRDREKIEPAEIIIEYSY
jgi:hypothetical protein